MMHGCSTCGCGSSGLAVPTAATRQGSVSPPGKLPLNARLIAIHKMGGINQISPQMAFDVEVEPDTHGRLFFQYNVPRPSIPPGGSHCSDIRVRIKLDGQEIYVSEWLGYETRQPALPLTTDLLFVSGVLPGRRKLEIQPEGRVGGCNYGRLFAWDGTLLLFEP